MEVWKWKFGNRGLEIEVWKWKFGNGSLEIEVCKRFTNIAFCNCVY